MTAPLLAVEGLSKSYTDGQGARVLAVNAVSFALDRGEVLGLVGESGCGKSTIARLVMRLLPPDAGRILIEDEDIAALSGSRLKAIRRKVQIVFQDPFGSLNPRHKVGHIVGEPLIVHGLARDHEAYRARIHELLHLVGLPDEAVERFPHEFSGGQRQRIALARALALEPALIIADEPVSALDVSIQSQILNLIAELRERLGLSMLFISHDLSVVRHVCDRVAVMKAGQIVETGATAEVFAAPGHPYTQALLAAVPRLPDEVV